MEAIFFFYFVRLHGQVTSVENKYTGKKYQVSDGAWTEFESHFILSRQFTSSSFVNGSLDKYTHEAIEKIIFTLYWC